MCVSLFLSLSVCPGSESMSARVCSCPCPLPCPCLCLFPYLHPYFGRRTFVFRCFCVCVSAFVSVFARVRVRACVCVSVFVGVCRTCLCARHPKTDKILNCSFKHSRRAHFHTRANVHARTAPLPTHRSFVQWTCLGRRVFQKSSAKRVTRWR